MIHVDTSALVAAAEPGSDALARLKILIATGEPIGMSAVVLFEWLRRPRTAAHLAFQSTVLPEQDALPFGPAEARQAAAIYRQVLRARSREIDIAIAASAIVHDAALWTLNPQDFRDIPGLKLL